MFLEISQKLTEKHLCQSLFFNEVAGLRHATLLKMRLWHRCFPVNFAKFLRTHFLQKSSWRLLLLLLRWNVSVTSGLNKVEEIEQKRDYILNLVLKLYMKNYSKCSWWKYVRRMQKILNIWKPRHPSKKKF